MGHYNCTRTTEEIRGLSTSHGPGGQSGSEAGPAQHYANHMSTGMDHMETKGSNWIRLVSHHTWAMKSLSS